MSNRKMEERVTRAQSRAAIARRYIAGEGLASIAADYDISVSTVRVIAVSEGAKPRPVGRPRKK